MKFSFFQKNKTLWVVFFFFIFAGILFFGNSGTASASAWGWITSPIGSAISAAGDGFKAVIVWLLVGILKFEGYLLSAAVALFAYIVDPIQLTNIIDNPAVTETWKMVRDSLNFAFIIMLLFSAFSTIFQVEKYSYKKILLHLVLMALLVNFSFPIVRFIIDISNVLMYTLLNNLFPDAANGSIFSTIADKSGLGTLINPGDKLDGADLSFLFAAIIFVFIFMITIMTLAILLVIRAIALAILIIFSPIGFVASISPATSNYADDYWKELFKYAFFGPILIFTLSVAVTMITKIAENGGGMDMIKFANSSSNNQTFVTTMAFFSVPIIIMWMGIGLAQKMGIKGAEMASKAGKAAVIGATAGVAAYGLKKSGIAGGLKQKVDDMGKKGLRIPFTQKTFGGSDRLANREAGVAKFFGVKGAGKKVNSERIKSDSEKLDSNTASSVLTTTTDGIDKHKQAKARTIPPRTKDQKIDAAANARAAINKGKEYEREYEADIRKPGGTLDTNLAAKGHIKPSATPPPLKPIPNKAKPGQIAQIQQENEKARQAYEKSIKDYEKATTDEIEKLKTEHFRDLRTLIQEGEDA